MKYIKTQKNDIEFSIDDEDYDMVSRLKWYINKQGYVFGLVPIHKLITNAGDAHIDHIDGNPLNNTRSNLRAVSRIKNNRGKRANKTYSSSKYKGVSLYQGRWRARVKVNNKVIYCGCFDTEEEAAIARDKVARDYFGEDGAYNFPTGEERAAVW